MLYKINIINKELNFLNICVVKPYLSLKRIKKFNLGRILKSSQLMYLILKEPGQN